MTASCSDMLNADHAARIASSGSIPDRYISHSRALGFHPLNPMEIRTPDLVHLADELQRRVISNRRQPLLPTMLDEHSC
jgi:hypothetical protein